MRGRPEQQLAMLTTLSTEDLISKDHRIRRVRTSGCPGLIRQESGLRL